MNEEILTNDITEDVIDEVLDMEPVANSGNGLAVKIAVAGVAVAAAGVGALLYKKHKKGDSNDDAETGERKGLFSRFKKSQYEEEILDEEETE